MCNSFSLLSLPAAPGVWVLFGQFAVDKMYEFEEGTEFPRKVFERAILSCGHHVTKVRTFFNIYTKGSYFGMMYVHLKVSYLYPGVS